MAPSRNHGPVDNNNEAYRGLFSWLERLDEKWCHDVNRPECHYVTWSECHERSECHHMTWSELLSALEPEGASPSSVQASEQSLAWKTTQKINIVEVMEELGGEPRLLLLFPVSPQDIGEEKPELGRDPTVQNSNKHRRLDIDLNRLPHEIDVKWEVDIDWNLEPPRSTWLSLWNNREN